MLCQTSYPYMQSKVSGGPGESARLVSEAVRREILRDGRWSLWSAVAPSKRRGPCYAGRPLEARDIAELNKSADGAFRHGAGDMFCMGAWNLRR